MTTTSRPDEEQDRRGDNTMLAFSAFGEIQVRNGDRRLGPRDLGGIKSKQILEILLLNRGHAVSKDSLADLLWGDNLPSDYFGALESHVSVLRGKLQPGTKVRQSVIRTEPGGYRFVPDGATVDLDSFDALLADAERARPQKARELLLAALELAAGEVLEDEPDAGWSKAVRERYQARCVEACIAAAEASLRAGDPEAGLRLAERALRADHVAEAAYRVAMVAAYQLGRYDQALDTFEHCRIVLTEELGVQPLEETVALHQAISSRDPRLAHPSAAGGLRLGARRGIEPFLGRSEELAQVMRHVQAAVEGSFSVLAVEGEAGVGKTTLVDAALARLGDGVPVARTACSGLDRDFPCLAVVAALQKLYEDEDGAHRPTPLDDVLLAASVSSASGHELPPPWALESLAAIVRQHAPFVIVVDGLEGADEMSLAVLAHLRAACADAPVAFVAVTRDHGPDARPLALLDGAARLELGPLTATELEPSNIVELHERTGGHPLFVSAIIRAGGRDGAEAPVPSPVGELVAARSKAFGPREHRVLRAAAVLEEPFTAEAVAHLLDEETAEVAAVLKTLCTHRVLRSADGSYRFRHRLVRESLYQMLSPARRRLLASRLAGEPRRARRLEAAA